MKGQLLRVVLGIGFALICNGALATEDAVDDRPSSIDADNSGINARDAVDAGDQSSDPKDVEVTREIRKRVMDQDDLSMNAKNVKIITIDSVVTLRGPVDDEQESMTIAKIAQSVPNVKRVDNQLEIDAE